MRKMIKNYSVIVMTVLLITGCGTEKNTLSTVGAEAFITDDKASSTISGIEPSTTSGIPSSTTPTTLSTPIPVISSSPVDKMYWSKIFLISFAPIPLTSSSPVDKSSTYIDPEVSSKPIEESVPSITATPSPVPSNPTVVITNDININIPVNVNPKNNINPTPTPIPTTIPVVQNINPCFYNISDFSNVQGKNQWYYLYSDGTSYNNLNWLTNVNLGDFSDSEATRIAPTGLNPNNNSIFYAVLAWEANFDGDINISGNLRKFDIDRGDGIKGIFLKNDQKLYEKVISFNNNLGDYFNLNTDIKKGDRIYFKVNANDSHVYDTSILEIHINYL